MSFDVTIVGAGMVGQTLALLLADSDLRVAILDPAFANKRPQTDTSATPNFEGHVDRDILDQIDPRVSALTAETEQLLQRLNVWQHISPEQRCGYQHMTVWDAEGTGEVNFSANDVHLPNLGHIVENRVILGALYQQLQQQLKQNQKITLLPWQLSSVSDLDDNGQLTLTGHDAVKDESVTLKSHLVVGADGGQSQTRHWAGMQVREWDYHHSAIIATVRCENPHQMTAWQRFRTEGPLAFLPLAADSKTVSIVWSTVRDEADELMALEETAFCQRLSEAFEWRLGEVEVCSSRRCVPLYQRHATSYHNNGIVLIGDAAHSIHPLAGQGVNLGFKDSAALADELLSAHRRHIDINHQQVLQRYQRRRQTDNLATMAAMEGFKRLFETEQPVVRLLRNQGMRWFNAMPAVKNHVIMQAMGLNH